MMVLRRSLGRHRAFSSVDALFRDKIALGKTLPKLEDNDVKLQMYALYKQATDGPNAQPKPGMFDFVGKAKWEAWTNLGSLSPEEAKKQYCDLIDGLAQRAGAHSSSGPTTATSPTAPSPTKAGVQATQSGGITTLSWDVKAPLDNALVDALTDAIVAATNDPATKVLVLQLHPGAPSSAAAANTKALVQAIVAFPHPLGVIVHGPIHGLPVSLVGLADVVFCHERATFQVPLDSNVVAAHALIAKLGYVQANAVLLLGSKLSADDAHRHGLVTQVLNTEVDARAFAQLQRLASLQSDGGNMRSSLYRHQHKNSLLQETQ